MRDQVARQLERARIAARSTVIGTADRRSPVVTALARTMEKLHRERDIAIAIDVPDHARFRGEQQDLEEMIGNLVDNACKWAQARVAIEVLAERRPATTSRGCGVIVDDDGPGLSPPSASGWRSRGQRLDETKPGSGLGLSIVVELAGLYGGALTPRHRADRGPAGRTRAASGLTAPGRAAAVGEKNRPDRPKALMSLNSLCFA